MNINPCEEEVKIYLDKWNANEKYVLQEETLDDLFKEKYPDNKDIKGVLAKCSTLNDFYSTGIRSIFPVAKHIVNQNIDERLKEKDPSVVDDIASVRFNNGKVIREYSFASKYCNRYYPDDYPIYDSYVQDTLTYLKRRDHFDKFTQNDLKEYKKFKEILLNLKEFYHIDKISLKELDEYLWQVGKELKEEKAVKH